MQCTFIEFTIPKYKPQLMRFGRPLPGTQRPMCGPTKFQSTTEITSSPFKLNGQALIF